MAKHTMSMYQTKDAMIESMQADIDSLETENTDMFDRFNDEITDLRAQLAEARKDSERLRHVCDNEWLVIYQINEQLDTTYFVRENEKVIGTGYSYQEAVDNAMKGGE